MITILVILTAIAFALFVMYMFSKDSVDTWKRKYQSEIAPKDEEIRKLKQEIAKLSASIATLEKSIDTKNIELEQTRSDIQAKEKEIKGLKKEVEILADTESVSEGMNVRDENEELGLSDLDEEQRAAYALMEHSDENLFITGKAGTGKSALLNIFAAHTEKCILKLAPTGISALNIKGVTLHSAFGYNNLAVLSYDAISPYTIKLNADKRLVLKGADTIIIDEISMVRADILEKIDRILRLLNDKDEPFGGKQVILFGDIFQLPPIAKREERQYLNDKFGGIHFFNSFAYKKGNFKFIELTVNHRQNGDDTFFSILNDIRMGTVTDKQLSLLNLRTDYDETDLRIVTRLFSKKDDVEAYNMSELAKNHAKEFTFRAKILECDNNKPLNLETNFPISESLKIKQGALVMFVKNNGDKWANGTIGIVSNILKDKLRVAVNAETFDVYPAEFEQLEATYEEGKIKYNVTCKVSQYPLILAYAMTIHKAQGQTYGKIACDVSRCFAPGQAYVALSRVRTLDGLFLLNSVLKHHIQVDTDINDFYERCKTPSIEADDEDVPF